MIIFQGECFQKDITIVEYINEKGSWFEIDDGKTALRIEKYDFNTLDCQYANAHQLYLGHSMQEVMDSGRDILGQEILSRGQPSYEKVLGILPRNTGQELLCDAASWGAVLMFNCGYRFLDSNASWSGVIVDGWGNVFPQRTGSNIQPFCLFNPLELDSHLGSLRPRQSLLEGYLPIIVSIYEGKNEILETMMFVEAGDPDRDPLVFIRAFKYDRTSFQPMFDDYYLVSLSRHRKKSKTTPDLFWDAFMSTYAEWDDTIRTQSALSIPEKQLELAVKGTMISMFTTFSGEHPHYGHREYGRELHDHFPPTVITAIEACVMWGHTVRARRMIEHILAHIIDQSGRFVYRQGDSEIRGAAGTEYGQLLWLIARFESVLQPKDWIIPYLEKITKMGQTLLNNRKESPDFPGKRLVRMCAEADTNGRIYDYVQNNFWAVRGLFALSQLLNKYEDGSGQRFFEESSTLLTDIRDILQEVSMPTEYGPLVPFQLEYRHIPLTLSNCRDTYYPVDSDFYKQYMNLSNLRGALGLEQDYSENTYANYRYYPEMLSARLLNKSEEDAIVNLREVLGGELLGMSRLYNRVDDWPVFNYARFLLETDRIDKYLLLLYAHTAYHGLANLMVYFEQFSINGMVMASDCVPSLLLAPLMIVWMFCFEPVSEDALYLLRGIPRAWYEHSGFSINDIITSRGAVGISFARNDKIRSVTVVLPASVCGKTVYLDLPGIDGQPPGQLKAGGEHIEKITDCRACLKSGIHGRIVISWIPADS